MGPHEGRSDQTPRSLSDTASARQGHDAADADLRRQRESKVAVLGGWLDTPRQDTRVRGLAVSRATRHHGGEVRLERGNAKVAFVQSQSLADMVAVNAPFTGELLYGVGHLDVITATLTRAERVADASSNQALDSSV